ncbi:MFS transporter [Rhizobium leguminosarum]|uniref:General substrate transporter n=1 Tax=Rhizobium leguminosarum bv. trifolii (strain WSM1325) TaxID=395491 RepID=C6B058_RHILS|nr:MFS transporter [Rhizobium leguminosarum]ACS58466.1 General substrate transporter [Rhizobium leguminosarum bv. trifolii WSM1325]MBY2911527.1 MHS family MFS transporter [Rhizobium leguminosarum]MBY2917110.1 MHS family MFS transporter [Rhizobium leguminosarum]MBY2935932.1 MHS family MFS transporter [Rhizobium leguminosarum]MBY2951568.1 MHS family MFS transporter [Rhizobium leguminosarum]
MANVASIDGAKAGPMTGEEKKVIFASSLGTVFEWYDFYLYGSLATYIGATYFTQYPEATRNIFTLLAFAAGFLVRPFGALVFGRLGDLVGRKYTFLMTIMIMGLSTFLVGILPGAATIGIAAPIILIALRLLQGLALGGEYGGAATYVAEHAPNGRRGYFTSWIQTTATLGLFLSLIVIVLVQYLMGAAQFAAWGWRIPFLVSVVLLGISVWIRLRMNESPAFQRMKAEGKGSKAPLTEAFGTWKNAKIAIIALLGATMGQAVVWYGGQFYALFFLQNVLKVDLFSANVMVAIALLLGTPFFVIFGGLSDKIGRKPIIMAGLFIAAVTYNPLFKAMTWTANPALAEAQASIRATVTADPADCRFQFNPTGTTKFTSSCDVATAFLTRNSVPYDVVPGTAGQPATVKVGNATIPSFDVVAAGDKAKGMTAAFEKSVNIALHDAGYPLNRGAVKVPDAKLDAFIAANPELSLNADAVRAGEKETVPAAKLVETKLLTADEANGVTDMTVYNIANGGTFAMVADPARVNWIGTIAVLFVLVFYVTMVYGPIAALLVELFPTRIRYTGMSLPYHIGNGWFGGLLPATAFAMSAAAGDIYYGLWYPIVFATITLVIGLIFLPETKNRDIHAMD